MKFRFMQTIKKNAPKPVGRIDPKMFERVKAFGDDMGWVCEQCAVGLDGLKPCYVGQRVILVLLRFRISLSSVFDVLQRREIWR